MRLDHSILTVNRGVRFREALAFTGVSFMPDCFPFRFFRPNLIVVGVVLWLAADAGLAYVLVTGEFDENDDLKLRRLLDPTGALTLPATQTRVHGRPVVA